MDVIMECNAPFYGDVVTIYEPLAYYRIHDSNDNMYHVVDKARFDKLSRYITVKLDYFAGRCRTLGREFDPKTARNRSIWALECRLVCGKLGSSGDRLEEPVWRTLTRAIRGLYYGDRTACIEPSNQRSVVHQCGCNSESFGKSADFASLWHRPKAGMVQPVANDFGKGYLVVREELMRSVG